MAKKVVFVSGKKQLPKYLTMVFCMILVAVLEMLGIGVMLPLVSLIANPQIIAENNAFCTFLSWFDVAPDESMAILIIGVGVAAVYLAKNMSLCALTALQGNILHTERTRLSNHLFMHYARLPYSVFLNKNTVNLIHNATGQINTYVIKFIGSIFVFIVKLM